MSSCQTEGCVTLHGLTAPEPACTRLNAVHECCALGFFPPLSPVCELVCLKGLSPASEQRGPPAGSLRVGMQAARVVSLYALECAGNASC